MNLVKTVYPVILEGIVPRDHIFGAEFHYKSTGEIDTIIRATAGYGKVAVLPRSPPLSWSRPAASRSCRYRLPGRRAA